MNNTNPVDLEACVARRSPQITACWAPPERADTGPDHPGQGRWHPRRTAALPAAPTDHHPLAQPAGSRRHSRHRTRAASAVAGRGFEFRFQLPDPGTIWYHPHTTETVQLEKGLYGPLIVDGTDDLRSAHCSTSTTSKPIRSPDGSVTAPALDITTIRAAVDHTGHQAAL